MRLSIITTISTVAAAAIKHRASDWDYQNGKIQGVNLGGWLLLEPYITPSLFEAFEPGEIPVDDYHYQKVLGKEEAKRRLDSHYDSWYQEADFQQMAAAGINTVRIPIGYWAYGLLPDDPYIQGQDFYLERAIGWARKNGINVLVDLHGAPGSQNGGTSSGLRGNFDSLEDFHKSIGYQSDENVELTLTVLQKIFDKYGGEEYADVVSGIGLLNEPLGFALDMGKLQDFYRWGYGNMRSVSSNNIVLSDAFEEKQSYWDNFMTVDQGFWKVVFDHHHYQWHSFEELNMTVPQHVQTACNYGKNHTKEYHWNIVGEWSAAMTDCAPWLNGIGRGSRWEDEYLNTTRVGSCEPYASETAWTDEYKRKTRQFIEGQMDAFSTASGWFFWNWKTENAVEWDMAALIRLGVFPQPFSDRQFPGQCGELGQKQ